MPSPAQSAFAGAPRRQTALGQNLAGALHIHANRLHQCQQHGGVRRVFGTSVVGRQQGFFRASARPLPLLPWPSAAGGGIQRVPDAAPALSLEGKPHLRTALADVVANLGLLLGRAAVFAAQVLGDVFAPLAPCAGSAQTAAGGCWPPPRLAAGPAPDQAPTGPRRTRAGHVRNRVNMQLCGSVHAGMLAACTGPPPPG